MVGKKETRQLLRERLVELGLAPSQQIAERQILAGIVRVNGTVVDKVGAQVAAGAEVTVVAQRQFVSRGGYKLEAALTSFPVAVSGNVCADVGACTGGFTEVLLIHGAAKVYSIDVGYGDLDWKLRSDPRVVVMERTNVRYLDSVGEPVSLVVIDVSFISLAKVLPVVVQWLVPGADLIALVKPQFEAAREDVGEGGIVTDPEIHKQVLTRVSGLLPALGLELRGIEPSPILGTEGNREFLLWASRA